MVSIARSRCSGRTGAKPKPQLPIATEVTVPQQQTRRELRQSAIHERDLTVDHDVAVAAGALHAPPFAARKIVYHRARFDPQTVVVVHDDVRRVSLAPCHPEIEQWGSQSASSTKRWTPR